METIARGLSKSILAVAAVTATIVWPMSATADDYTLHSFTRQALADVYYSEGAAAGDLNGDGAADVVYGPYWYEGPKFQTKHEIYPAKAQPRERYADHFFAWIYDFNGDGWNDVFAVGFPGTPAYVYAEDDLRERARATVEAFAADHGSWPAFGYKFHTPDRTIVISGDTAPTESCVEAAQGCDVLIHEVQSAAGLEGRSPAWQRYHSSVHTSSLELAEMASRAKPELLILYHQLFHGVSERELLLEVQGRYAGPVISGKDPESY